MAWRVGVDSGGTFTDVCLFDDEPGRIEVWKVPSTPDDPSRGIAAGRRRRASGASDAAPARRRLFRPRHHGRHQRADPASRRAHRADHHRRASATCWRSAGRSGRTSTTCRPTSRQSWSARDLRLEVPERVRHDGTVETPLDEAAVRAAARRAARRRREGGRGLLPLRLHRGPAHEAARPAHRRRGIPRRLRLRLHEVAPEFREYERLSTAVVNAYLGPVMRRYIRRLGRRLAALGMTADAASHPVQRRRDRLRARRRGCRCAPCSPAPAPAWSARRRSARLAGLRRPHHLRHGRHLHRRGAARRTASAGWPARPWCTAIRSRRRCSTSTPSAPAAARSPMSIAAGC